MIVGMDRGVAWAAYDKCFASHAFHLPGPGRRVGDVEGFQVTDLVGLDLSPPTTAKLASTGDQPGNEFAAFPWFLTRHIVSDMRQMAN